MRISSRFLYTELAFLNSEVREREGSGRKKRPNETKRERVIIYCFVEDCRHQFFVITSLHCLCFFFAGLHFRMVHFTMAIQSCMNGFSAARFCGSIKQMMFCTSHSGFRVVAGDSALLVHIIESLRHQRRKK